MFYTPVSEKEAMDDRYQLLKDGHYPKCKLLDMELRRSSQSGNAYTKITLGVVDEKGNVKWIFCNLTDHPSMRYLMRHFCEGLGLIEPYNSGTLTPEMIASKKDTWLRGGVKIGIKKARPKEDGSGEEWAPQNTVLDFGQQKSADSTPEKTDRAIPPQSPEFDDEIPF